ncbi:uncharacterized protein LOC100017974 [Monodelphis domestica]|uniref:uncharacterized protein LOC100017974 n=1 Tax=Monodelphis domestica TaxID=13616 RepID=UPI0004436156|nr:uncharacterized protein LOC100017974 [Monodelphis domestica]
MKLTMREGKGIVSLRNITVLILRIRRTRGHGGSAQKMQSCLLSRKIGKKTLYYASLGRNERTLSAEAMATYLRRYSFRDVTSQESQTQCKGMTLSAKVVGEGRIGFHLQRSKCRHQHHRPQDYVAPAPPRSLPPPPPSCLPGFLQVTVKCREGGLCVPVVTPLPIPRAGTTFPNPLKLCRGLCRRFLSPAQPCGPCKFEEGCSCSRQLGRFLPSLVGPHYEGGAVHRLASETRQLGWGRGAFSHWFAAEAQRTDTRRGVVVEEPVSWISIGGVFTGAAAGAGLLVRWRWGREGEVAAAERAGPAGGGEARDAGLRTCGGGGGGGGGGDWTLATGFSGNPLGKCQERGTLTQDRDLTSPAKEIKLKGRGKGRKKP